ncbi:MAG: protein kinase [Deltaproteobacteria bacterium]|nr:protein kinase [Deltaproteobacteria bacterium]
MAEEILNALAHVQGLRVVGRTSSFSFRDTASDLRTIGRQLGAATLLEGSVRRDGGRVRIGVQLVKAADGYQLWSETYDRALGSIFDVQDEIARAVVTSLQLTLLPERLARERPSLEAHARFLLGRQLLRQGSLDGFRGAEKAFREAAALDARYAPVQVGLSEALWGRYRAGDSASADETESLCRETLAAAERAVELAPDLAEAVAARGAARAGFRWDWAGSVEDHERALALNGNAPDTLRSYGFLLARLGRLQAAIGSLRLAAELDPLSAEVHRLLGYVLLAAGEAAQARQALEQALEIAPINDWALQFRAVSSLLEGRAGEALSIMERSRTEGWRLWGKALAGHSMGKEPDSRRALEGLVECWAHVGTYQIAQVIAWRGDREHAFEWLERCYRSRDVGLTYLKLDRLMQGLRGDPRWNGLLVRMGLPADPIPESRGSLPAAAEVVRPGALSALLQEIASAPTPSDGGWGAALLPGATIGKFELVREIGSGGFGVVWEARDRELGRSVAFKAVRAGGKAGLREERLLREAEAAARLAHPNIVTLFDLGRAEAGPYLVLELLSGQTLEERLGEGPLPLREAVRIAAETAKGVAHAHQHGVVHRDLKPANVFLCDDGQVKVLDFGLAHAFGQRRQDGGTPAYMAPEQWEGAPEDERTDVFALGVMLYRMLSGELPFADPDGRDHLSKEPAPALEIAEQPELGALVGRMLAKRPVERPRDGAEVAGAIKELQQELERVPGIGPSAVRTRRRPGLRLLALAVAGAVAGALVAGGVAWWRLERAPRPVASADGRIVVAVADVVNETGEKELDVLSGLLVTSLEQSRRLSVMTQARVLDLAIRAGRKDAARVDETIGREVGKASGVRALLLPAIRKLGATYSLEMRAIDPVRDEHLFTASDRAASKEALLDLLDRLSERARNELGEGKAELAGSSVQLGAAMTRSLDAYQHYLAGQEAWLRDGLRATGLREFREALRLDPGFSAAHVQLAHLLHHSYDLPALAAPHWKAANEGLDRMPEKERLLFRLKRAHYHSTFEHFSREEALRLADEALARFPDDKFALISAADAFETFGLPDRYKPVLHRAAALDPGYFSAAASLAEWGGATTAESLEVARRAVATRRSAANLGILATALWAAGDDDGAVAAARESLRAGGSQHSLIAIRACDVLREKGIGADCLQVWRDMVSGGLNEHERAYARLRLAEGLVHRGRIREALRNVDAAPGLAVAVSPEWLARIYMVGHPRNNAPQALEAARRISNPQFRRNYLTWLGATEEAARITTSLGGRGYEVTEQINRAMDQASRGRPAEAAETIAAVREEMRRRSNSTWTFSQAAFHAEVLLAAGRAEEAAGVWPATFPCRCTDQLDHGSFYPLLVIHRARAMELLGRRADAIRELDGVLDFWKEADSDLPLLVEAKAMRKRLAKGPALAKGAAAAAPTPSIAVLPFADLSPGKDQEYFADGVAEEILNALSRVKGLKVVGRTSSFSFKGKKEDLRNIGKKLGVAHVLEGSLRKEGGRVRVAAQLVKAADGYQLWSQSYDRELTGIFEVQDEVARAVASALAGQLLASGSPGALRPAPTTTPEAYELYLQGRQHHQRLSYKTFGLAVQAYERALELDPKFALAWAGLGIPLLYDARRAPTRAEERAQQLRALAAAERALELAPDLVEGLRARGFLRQTVAWDWEGARADLERAVRLYPGDPGSWHVYGVLLDNLGRSAEAIAAVERAVALDPLSSSWLKLGQVQEGAGRIDLARASFERARLILPHSPVPRWALAGLDLLEGRAQEALRVFEELAADGVASQKDMARALHSLGRKADAEVVLEKLMTRKPRAKPLDVASACAWMQRLDCSFEWLDRAWNEHDGELGEAFRTRPDWRPLHSDPRWKELLRKLNLPGE